jgi:hypothetical protein
MQFEISYIDENGDHVTKEVSEMEFRAWLQVQVDGKMLPSRIDRYIDERVREEKCKRR